MADISVLNTTAAISGKTLLTTEGDQTITGAHTFDRDPSAPFVVTASSAVVTNLDADKLDGSHGSAFLTLAGGTMTGDLLFTDALYDIGKSAATRPRDVFLSRNLTVGTAISGQLSPRLQSVTSAATVTPAPDTNDLVVITAQAAALVLANPTPVVNVVQGQLLTIRVTDDGTARAITYGTQYQASGIALPTTTVISTPLVMVFQYNTTGPKWILIASTVAASGGPMTLLKAGSGTDTSAAAATVDSVAITGLTAKDTIVVEANWGSTTQATAQPIGVYHVTDSAFIANNTNSMAAAVSQFNRFTLRQDQSGNTALVGVTEGINSAAGVQADYKATTVTTAWTGSWTLGIRHSGVTAGGTFRYSYAIYKLAGQ